MSTDLSPGCGTLSTCHSKRLVTTLSFHLPIAIVSCWLLAFGVKTSFLGHNVVTVSKPSHPEALWSLSLLASLAFPPLLSPTFLWHDPYTCTFPELWKPAWSWTHPLTLLLTSKFPWIDSGSPWLLVSVWSAYHLWWTHCCTAQIPFQGRTCCTSCLKCYQQTACSCQTR